MMSITTLPAPVLKRIAQHLRPKSLESGSLIDLGRFSRTCKVIREVVNPVLWNVVEVKTPQRLANVLKAPEERLRLINSLTLRFEGNKHLPAGKNVDAFWRPLSRCTALESLDISIMDPVETTRPQDLTQPECSFPIDPSITFPHLTSLRWEVNRIPRTLCYGRIFPPERVAWSDSPPHPHFPRLERLALVMPAQVLYEVAAMTDRFSTVTEANIKTLGFASSTAFEGAMVLCPNVEVLEVGAVGSEFHKCETGGCKKGFEKRDTGKCIGAKNVVHLSPFFEAKRLKDLSITLTGIFYLAKDWGNFSHYTMGATPPPIPLTSDENELVLSAILHCSTPNEPLPAITTDTSTQAIRLLASRVPTLEKVAIACGVSDISNVGRQFSMREHGSWERNWEVANAMEVKIRRKEEGKVKAVKGKMWHYDQDGVRSPTDFCPEVVAEGS